MIFYHWYCKREVFLGCRIIFKCHKLWTPNPRISYDVLRMSNNLSIEINLDKVPPSKMFSLRHLSHPISTAIALNMKKTQITTLKRQGTHRSVKSSVVQNAFTTQFYRVSSPFTKNCLKIAECLKKLSIRNVSVMGLWSQF